MKTSFAFQYIFFTALIYFPSFALSQEAPASTSPAASASPASVEPAASPSPAGSATPSPTTTPNPRTLRILGVDASGFPKIRVEFAAEENSQPKKIENASDIQAKESDQVRESSLAPAAARSLVLAADTSGSMLAGMTEFRARSSEFLSGLGKDDLAAIIAFSRDVSVIRAPTADRASLREGAQSLIANGESALYDAMCSASDLLGTQKGRRLLLLVTDGVDDDGYGKAVSSHTQADVSASLKAKEVKLIAVSLGDKPDKTLLSNWADQTHGRHFSIPSIAGIGAVYQQISEALKAESTLVFTTGAKGDGLKHAFTLVWGETQISGEFQSPVISAAAPVRNTQLSAPPPSGRGQSPAPGTSRNIFSQAAPLPVDSWSHISNSVLGSEAKYFSFEAAPGQLIQISLQQQSQNSEQIVLYSSDFRQLKDFYFYFPFGKSSFEYLVPFGSGNPFYLMLKPKAELDLLIHTANRFDGPGQTDAGRGDLGAVSLKPNEEYVGYLFSPGDEEDVFHLHGLTSGEWTLIVRPANRCSATAEIQNLLGQRLKIGYSSNAGAALSLRFTAPPEMRAALRIRPSPDNGYICPYALRFGRGDIQPPNQPEQ